MKGANKYYNLIQNAYSKGIGELRKLKLKHGWNGGDSEAFLCNNLVFVTSSHARGKCFRIYLIDRYESDEDVKRDAFEVYGVVHGHRGWTEEYGWLHEGKWVKEISEYLTLLQFKLEELAHVKKQEQFNREKQERKELQDKLDTFNELFT